MALVDLWRATPEQLQGKRVQQVIAFAGDGRLSDSGNSAVEFRAFLSHIPSDLLEQYAKECLDNSFKDSGLALQDIVNEIGARIGAQVSHGRYRGTSGEIGFDGLWAFPNGHNIVLEVKTTDAFRIDLTTIADYRRALIQRRDIEKDSSSILIVVGRQDTGDLEAQIRGSRHAWDIRIISVDALLRLLKIKEEVDDPGTIERIHQVLIPREFTRLDEIADLIFSTAEELTADVEEEDDADDDQHSAQDIGKTPKFTPVAFHQACIDRVQKHLGITLLKRSRAKYSSPDGRFRVNIAVSREYGTDLQPRYWFVFHPHQREFLAEGDQSFAAFGCGSSDQILLVPFSIFDPLVDFMNMTEKEARYYWHVRIRKDQDVLTVHQGAGNPRKNLSEFLIPIHA